MEFFFSKKCISFVELKYLFHQKNFMPMKRISFLVCSAFLVLSISSCKKLGELCKDLNGFSTTITTNAVTAPGSVTVSKSFNNTIATDLSSYGANVNNVNSLTVLPITVTIPANAGFTFADISSASITANGQLLGSLPVGATGLTATFTSPSVTDIKTSILLASTINAVFTANFNKAVAASSVDVKIPVNACYQVL